MTTKHTFGDQFFYRGKFWKLERYLPLSNRWVARDVNFYERTTTIGDEVLDEIKEKRVPKLELKFKKGDLVLWKGEGYRIYGFCCASTIGAWILTRDNSNTSPLEYHVSEKLLTKYEIQFNEYYMYNGREVKTLFSVAAKPSEVKVVNRSDIGLGAEYVFTVMDYELTPIKKEQVVEPKFGRGDKVSLTGEITVTNTSTNRVRINFSDTGDGCWVDTEQLTLVEKVDRYIVGKKYKGDNSGREYMYLGDSLVYNYGTKRTHSIEQSAGITLIEE